MDACTRGHQALGQLKRHTSMVIQDFIKSLKPKIKNKFANKFAEGQVPAQNSRPCIFTCARSREEKSRLLTLSGMTSWDSRTPAMVNEVQSHPLDKTRAINEISSNSSYRNNNSKGNYNSKSWHQRGDNKPWQSRDNKHWQNKGQ